VVGCNHGCHGRLRGHISSHAGRLTANVAAYFIEKGQEAEVDPVTEQLAEILRRLDRIEARLERPVSDDA
jgi:hypothetical protein